MRKTIFLLLVVAGIFICAGQQLVSAAESFKNVVDNLDLKKNTKLHVREYWKGIEGKEVMWSGTVFDVKAGRGKAEILIADKSRQTIKGYNIKIVVYDLSKAAGLKKRQTVRFKGYLHDFSAGRHGGVFISLRDAEIF